MNSIIKISWTLLFLAVMILAGCCEDPATCPSDNQRTIVPATLESRINNTNEFAWDLYCALKSAEGNLIVSPHSITTTFGMAYGGARGKTEKEIATVLHFNYPPVGFHVAMKQLNDLLMGRGQWIGPESFRLNIANSCWGRNDMTYLAEYLDLLSEYYGADMGYLDFAGEPEASRVVINQWVEDETYGLIRDLIPPNSLDSRTYLVLANAIYFKASWLHQFDPYNTKPAVFTKLDGSTVNVSLMEGEEYFPYHDGDGYQLVELPYKGEECSMVLILPDEGTYLSFEDALTPAKLKEIVDAGTSTSTSVIVSLPKFSFATEYELAPTLSDMGMHGAFEPGANFSGMDGTDDGIPWISFVAHKTFIYVDEFGTMAAAGTGMGFSIGMPARFKATRPFIFVIRDRETGTILFLGRVLDPSVH